MSTLTTEQNELLDLRDRVFELEEENRDLRRRLADTLTIPPHWGLTRLEGRILMQFAEVEKPLSEAALHARIYGPDARCSHVLAVHVGRIRRKLAPHKIEIVQRWGEGWLLSPAARTIVARALRVERVE